jgi:hypothetical protein
MIVMTMIVMTMIVMTMIVMTMIVMTMIVMTMIVMTMIVHCFRRRSLPGDSRRMLVQISRQMATRRLQIPATIDRNRSAFVEIELPCHLLSIHASPLDSNHPPGRTNLLHLPGYFGAILNPPANPKRGAVAKNCFLDGPLLMEPAENGKQDAGPPFLHGDGGSEQVQRRLMPNPLHQKRHVFGSHVVDLGLAD